MLIRMVKTHGIVLWHIMNGTIWYD